MKDSTISKLIKSEISDFIVGFIIGTIVFVLAEYCLLNYFNDEYMIVFIILIFIVYVRTIFVYFVGIIKLLILKKYIIKKFGHDTEKIIWCNTATCFLFDDRIIMYKYKIVEIKYKDIDSIQLYKGIVGHNNVSYYYYDMNLWTKNDKKYSFFMYCDDCTFEPYNGIKNITRILLEKNPNIVVKEMDKSSSFVKTTDEI